MMKNPIDKLILQAKTLVTCLSMVKESKDPDTKDYCLGRAYEHGVKIGYRLGLQKARELSDHSEDRPCDCFAKIDEAIFNLTT